LKNIKNRGIFMVVEMVKEVFHEKLVGNKKELRDNYLSPMNIPIGNKSYVIGRITKSLNPSLYEFENMKEDLETAMRLEERLQKLKKGNGYTMQAHEFIRELGKW